jgi:hypothetical protein
MGGVTLLRYRFQTIVNLSQSDRIFTCLPCRRPLPMNSRWRFLVGTVRCAVRAASSGATSVAGRSTAGPLPRFTRGDGAARRPYPLA